MLIAHTLVIHVVDKCLNIRNLPAMWRWYLCLEAQHHKISKDIQKIQTNNVQQIYHGGQGQIISDEVEKGRFWQNTDPCTFIRVLQFSSLIKKCKINWGLIKYFIYFHGKTQQRQKQKKTICIGNQMISSAIWNK